MPRGGRDRSNMKIGTFEKKYGLPLGAMRSKEGERRMGSRIITVAPYDNKKAWEKADFICDGIEDNVEIQHAINLASELKKGIRFRHGTYRIFKDVEIKPSSNKGKEEK